MTIVGLDIGKSRIGIAKSDPLNILASPVEVYKCTKNLGLDAKYISNKINEFGGELVVIGLPIKLNGEQGDSVKMAQDFGAAVQKFNKTPIVFFDERLSTVEAEEILIHRGYSREKRKMVIDAVAATIILQSYIDAKK